MILGQYLVFIALTLKMNIFIVFNSKAIRLFNLCIFKRVHKIKYD